MNAADVRTWRYSLPSVKGEGWAVIFVDSLGYFAAITDWGDYSYRWAAHGKNDFREFVAGLGRDPDYLLCKVSARQFNAQETERAVKRRIVELRREGCFTAEAAREEWDLVERSSWSDIVGFTRWCDETAIEEPWFLSQATYPGQAQAFVKHVLPRLSAVIAAELAQERAPVPAEDITEARRLLRVAP